MLRGIDTLGSLAGSRVLLRASLNVPLEDGVIQDTARIDDTVPTIRALKEKGGRVIVISHLSGGEDASLAPVAAYLETQFPVVFVEDPFSEEGSAVLEAMQDGDVVLCENIRKHAGEKDNDPEFAARLASLADVYVNDDFTATHREHASIVGVPEHLPSRAGIAFMREYDNLSRFDPLSGASLAIVGGAKPETKLPLIAALAERFTHVYAGGVSANAVFEDRGFGIGRSLSATKHIPNLDAVSADSRIMWPSDSYVEGADGTLRVDSMPEEIKSEEAIVDAGPGSLRDVSDLIARAELVVWNGPLGDYEEGYTEATHALAHVLAECDADVVIGGGDTLASIQSLGLFDSFTFVSNAGGAMLHFFAYGSLPGVEALKRSS